MNLIKLKFGSFFIIFLTSLGSSAAWSKERILLDGLEASVNKDLILRSDLERFRKVIPLRAQLDPLFSGTPMAAQGNAASDQEIANFLIDEALITQQFPVTDAETEQEINSIQSSNHIDRTELKRALSEQGFTFDQYYKLIQKSSSKRNLIDREIRTRVNISDDDVKNYFYNHYAKTTAEAHRSYHLQMITISNSTYKTPSLANTAAIQALKDIKKGEPFEEVAKRVSDDATAPSGGDLGTLNEDQISPAIRDQVKKLQIGEVSPILGSTAQGRMFILKLKDVKSTETERFEKMKDEIRNKLAANEYQHQISLWLERKRQTAFIHKSGEPFAKFYSEY